MEKIVPVIPKTRRALLFERVTRYFRKFDRLSAEDCFEALTAVMYRLILFLGVPYLVFQIVRFLFLPGN
ncbi:hypothetical protein [Sporolactobacillus vineae]|uniref:hypothetical protein n=1 Tax=Sporolactobacillus vineae TaxID=444463 RepID=UPI000288EA96|nr:hypothetical protein [Sporolactobacillus vineae]